METRKLCVLLVISAFLIKSSVSQNCGVMVDITATSPERILVNQMGTERLCIRCLDAAGEISPQTTWSLADGRSISDTETAPDVGEYFGGILVLLPGILGNGSAGEYGPLSCSFGVDLFLDKHLVSTVLIPPTILFTPIRVLETAGPAIIRCNNPNSPEVSTGFMWFRAGNDTVLSTSQNLIFLRPVVRDSSGDYVCQVTSLLDGSLTASAPAELIVEFVPEVSFNHPSMISEQLNATLELTCNYIAVPMPTVQWFLNGTRLLDPSNPRITVTNTGSSSQLTVEQLNRDEGGDYSCILSNNRGMGVGNVTTLLILIPPAPVANLAVGEVLERTIELSWTIVFNGFTSITSARVDYFIEGQNTETELIEGSTPTTTTLEGLMPFVTYNITVFLTNIVGTSDPMSITATTLSLFLGAPTVTVTADSSTMLTVMWTAPPDMPSTDPSRMWTVELQLVGGGMERTETTAAGVLMFQFDGLQKGTMYQARVRGENIRGPGNYSQYVIRETIIDPPDMPGDVTVETISSFALRVSWTVPPSDGGRPILRYIITVAGTAVNVFSNATSEILREPDVILFENTTYIVTVEAQNQVGIGPAGMDTGTTLDITQPQPLLDPARPSEETNGSVVLEWDAAEGMVDEYIIQYTIERTDITMSIRVNGTLTMFLLSGLDAGTSYSVVIITVNANGNSTASVAELFSTLPPDDPVVTGPDGPVPEFQDVELVCTSPDNKVIEWMRRDGMSIEDRVVFPRDGTMFRSVLTIRDVRVRNAGEYVCRVGQATGSYILEVTPATTSPPTTPPEGGISTTVIIIAACVAGGGLFLIIIGGIIIIACCCCGSKDSRKNQYSTKPPKTDKRTKELFEVSTAVSYAPVEGGGQRDTGVSFDMPEDFQGHSSFNTLDKQPKHRSSSPEAANTSSFGVGQPPAQSDPPRYQDMPPSYDGTVL